jgi:hypothetical protein
MDRLDERDGVGEEVGEAGGEVSGEEVGEVGGAYCGNKKGRPRPDSAPPSALRLPAQTPDPRPQPLDHSWPLTSAFRPLSSDRSVPNAPLLGRSIGYQFRTEWMASVRRLLSVSIGVHPWLKMDRHDGRDIVGEVSGEEVGEVGEENGGEVSGEVGGAYFGNEKGKPRPNAAPLSVFRRPPSVRFSIQTKASNRLPANYAN